MSDAARRLRLTGHVQGVGYRPFVYRLAHALGIRGWVQNVTGAVAIHAEGPADRLDEFTQALVERAPAIARPRLVEDRPADVEGHAGFAIRTSEGDAEPDIHVPPDYFTCDDCLREMADPGDRRHGYPFINCTQCGPRYTLITALPYDRPNTAMAGFPLCPDCRREYEDPTNRRFHAEPVACPVCGPHLSFVSATLSSALPPRGGGSDDEAALAAAVAALKAGAIVAVKGIGGYHLMCDASNDEAVAMLRRRKPRPAKPLAVMFPADGALLARTVRLEPAAKALLESPARPIVLATLIERSSLTPSPSVGRWPIPRYARDRNFVASCVLRTGPRGGGGQTLSPLIAPGLAEVGCFLPYSPLHHLLLQGFGGPLVATSGNVSGEPVLTDNAEAEARLDLIADAFLHHDRPIARPADDPVYRVITGRPRPIRLGRGVAPMELELAEPLPEPVLALGGHMKNALCLAWGRRAVLSPHIGELEAVRSREVMAQVAEDLQRLYQVRANRLLLDRHPGYGYRPWAHASGLPISEVWHHHAHASALAWEHPGVAEWIVFAWDGVGLGEDGQLWGGEAFTGAPGRWRRAARLRPFRLPGGDKAGRQPWRSAAALLWETGQAAPFAPELLHQAWQRGINSPVSSAAGRLFDAAAALTGVCSEASFEGEGPMRLEALATSSLPRRREPSSIKLDSRLRGNDETMMALERRPDGLWQIDWAPLLAMLMDDALGQSERALRFHQALADALVAQARRLAEATGSRDVGLTGGVFQNRLLTELACAGLAAAGLTPRLAERVPVNDAGVGLGQVVEFLHSQG